MGKGMRYAGAVIGWRRIVLRDTGTPSSFVLRTH
jgi:hypothetical protein